jgi:hypothetical protein
LPLFRFFIIFRFSLAAFAFICLMLHHVFRRHADAQWRAAARRAWLLRGGVMRGGA